ncbi:conserved hypothetical protein [Hyphomicrobiales bacterium]|nr:conserved hypothetical protein [Hyphomicrobiales bacterium]CAH1684704.1 conserved hypothetical protein [Hyphomicrobiales bacterium]
MEEQTLSKAQTSPSMSKSVAIIGAGPGGLMAAERLALKGHAVTIFERMPSPARKFLMAGRGGLNITHSEPLALFLKRYGRSEAWVKPALERFSPTDLRNWATDLGIETFVGSSGRVFPRAMKASPLLRAWLARLNGLGVEIRLRHSWRGFDEVRRPLIEGPDGEQAAFAADATLLALGGASWPRLGSDGSWRGPLAEAGVAVASFQPANCGFAVAWSSHMSERFSGVPVKRIALMTGSRRVRGEAVVTRLGIEGGAVYALADSLRDEISRFGKAMLVVDLRPDLTVDELARRLSRSRGSQSLSNHLRKAAALSPVATALLREPKGPFPQTPEALARHIKALPLVLDGAHPIERAISTAGGIALSELDEHFMLRRLPGVFAVGEMLDWEAPTGGYLLQATFSTAVAAAEGVDAYLKP